MISPKRNPACSAGPSVLIFMMNAPPFSEVFTDNPINALFTVLLLPIICNKGTSAGLLSATKTHS
jgi:hypothetical protein